MTSVANGKFVPEGACIQVLRADAEANDEGKTICAPNGVRVASRG